MRQLVLGLLGMPLIAGFSFGATVSGTETDRLVQDRKVMATARKYSEAVSCQIDRPAEVIRLRANDERGLGALYLTYWVADRGCYGGKGSVFVNYALIEQAGYASVDPVVVGTDDKRYRMPEMVLNDITRVSVRDGYLYVFGIGYGDKDEPGWPTSKKAYLIPIGRFLRNP
mgnify:CR=1 FL=1